MSVTTIPRFVSRDEWGAQPSAGGTLLLPAEVKGLAVHWPALSKPIRGIKNVSAALRGWQAAHMAKGWSDIAYQEAIDQDGNFYNLRGLRIRSAANGDTEPNHEFGAIVLVLAPGEKPTPAMIRTFRARATRFQEHFPDATVVVGHMDVRPEPTSCPGPIVMSLIRAGVLNPQAPFDEVKFAAALRAAIKEARRIKNAEARARVVAPLRRVLDRLTRKGQG